MPDFTKVEQYLPNAVAITWDECHKIYVLMDNEQIEIMRGYGYDPIILRDDNNLDDLRSTIGQWYADSCGLRFISAVSTNHDDPNEGFTDLIPQFADYEEEE